MLYNPEITDTDLPPDEEEDYSLVERIFDSPKVINEGEYITIYEFLLAPDIRDDPVMIANILKEFAGWAQYMLKRMEKLKLVERD